MVYNSFLSKVHKTAYTDERIIHIKKLKIEVMNLTKL